MLYFMNPKKHCNAFWFAESEFVQKILKFPSWRWNFLEYFGHANDFNLSDSEMTFFVYQDQTRLANAPEESLIVPGKNRSIVGGFNPNIVHALSTLVIFNKWV